MPLVGNRRKCERCREQIGRIRGSVERIRLMPGPDGERLCRKHHWEAWNEEVENADEGDTILFDESEGNVENLSDDV